MIPRPDYNKIIAASAVYDVRNNDFNRIQRSDINEIVRIMLTNNITTLSDLPDFMRGAPVTSSYIMYIHPALIEETMSIMGWIGIKMYPNRSSALCNEVGSVGNIRVIIDSSLERFVVHGPFHDDGDCTDDQFISVVQGFNGDKFLKENYIVVKSS